MLRDTTASSTFESYNKTTDISESLGQTVYGGTLDVRTGKFTVDKAIVDLGDLSWTYDETTRPADGTTIYAKYTYIPLSDCKKLPDNYVIPNMTCSMYSPASVYEVDYGGATNIKDNIISGADGNGRIWVYDSRFNNTNINDFVTAITGIKLVYELATPFTIQLTPHEINLLKDCAYVSTNGTSISLDYHNGEMASLSDVNQLGETIDKAIEFAKTYHSPVHMLKIHEAYVTDVDFLVPVWMEPFAGRNLCDALVVNNGQYTFEYSYGFRWVGDGTIIKIYETMNGNESDNLSAEILW